MEFTVNLENSSTLLGWFLVSFVSKVFYAKSVFRDVFFIEDCEILRWFEKGGEEMNSQKKKNRFSTTY